ncbi:MAG: hypothetical protein U0263_04020 [Polyangiaceae bacterium]
MLGPKLARLCTDDFALTAVRDWAKSLSLGAELSVEEWERAGEIEAAFEGMYLMAAADGDLSRDELLLLSASLQAILESTEARGVSRYELGVVLLKLSDIIAGFARALESDGIAARIRHVAGRVKSEPARRLALRMAAGVAFADDFVADGEIRTLDDLALALSFDHETALAELKAVHTALSG